MSQSLSTSSQRLFTEFPGAQGSATVSVWESRVSLDWFLTLVLTKAFLFTLSSFLNYCHWFSISVCCGSFCLPNVLFLLQKFKNHWPGKECLPNRLQNLQGLNEIIQRMLSLAQL